VKYPFAFGYFGAIIITVLAALALPLAGWDASYTAAGAAAGFWLVWITFNPTLYADWTLRPVAIWIATMTAIGLAIPLAIASWLSGPGLIRFEIAFRTFGWGIGGIFLGVALALIWLARKLPRRATAKTFDTFGLKPGTKQ